MRTHATCHPEKLNHSKGQCKSCYYRPYRAQKKIEGVVYPSHTVEAKRRDRLKILGWTLEGFEYTLLEQDNKCAICGREMNLQKKQNGTRACADHLHGDTPVPRGILCTNCNAMLGQAQENIGTLRSAIAYLEKFSLETAEEAKHLTVST